MAVCRLVLAWLTALYTVLATISLMAGMATPWWLQARDLDAIAGLWCNCVGDHCVSIVNAVGEWLIACQALAVTSLLTAVLTVGVVVAMVKTSHKSDSTSTSYGVIATSLFAGSSTSVTVLIYYLQHHYVYPESLYTLSLSFYLVLAAGGLFLLAGLQVTVSTVISPGKTASERPTRQGSQLHASNLATPQPGYVP